MLLHSPLVGPLTWDGVARVLRARGHEATTPSLVPALTGPRPLWQHQVATATEGAKSGVWIIAHSGAGPLLPAAIAELPVAPAGCVFADAGLPHPGRSRVESLPAAFAEHVVNMAEEGILPPWPTWFGDNALTELISDEDLLSRFAADCPPLPMTLFTEPLPTTNLPDIPCAYLRLSEAYRTEEESARELGWPTTDLGGHHLWPIDHPSETADAILMLINRSRGVAPLT